MKYSDARYGAAPYGPGNGEGGTGERPYIDLTPYIPEFWFNGPELWAAYIAFGYMAGALQTDLDELRAQLFVESATWGLNCWEQAFGLDTDIAKSFAFRRERVKAKIRGAGTATRQMIINLASAFAGGEATVIEYPREHRFVVKFVGLKGVPPNLGSLEAAIEEAKPAHLAFAFEYTYNYWDVLRGMTWGSLRPNTWDQVRII